MPSTQLQTDDPGLAICPDNIGELLDKEWLLTNDRGSYASGTVLGCNTRRYHGLLVASLHPPVERMVMLSNLLETVSLAVATMICPTSSFPTVCIPRAIVS